MSTDDVVERNGDSDSYGANVLANGLITDVGNIVGAESNSGTAVGGFGAVGGGVERVDASCSKHSFIRAHSQQLSSLPNNSGGVDNRN